MDSPIELQRGYGMYEVDGEKEEMALGPVGHLLFVIHGIGESFWRREDINQPSFIEQIDNLREAVHKTQYESWKKECQKVVKDRYVSFKLSCQKLIDLITEFMFFVVFRYTVSLSEKILLSHQNV